MPTFVSIDFQLSQKLFVIYFAEKQKNVEAAMFIIKVFCCAYFYCVKKILFCENVFCYLFSHAVSHGNGNAIKYRCSCIACRIFMYIYVTAFYFYVINLLFLQLY